MLDTHVVCETEHSEIMFSDRFYTLLTELLENKADIAFLCLHVCFTKVNKFLDIVS